MEKPLGELADLKCQALDLCSINMFRVATPGIVCIYLLLKIYPALDLCNRNMF
jgi:hypothetical protein